MLVHVKLSALKQGRACEYVGFCARRIGDHRGWHGRGLGKPAAGGLMRAFPAIFSASATLIVKGPLGFPSGLFLRSVRQDEARIRPAFPV
ncbi:MULTISPECIES: hypothetical protein [Bradyrhizobium]|uniref:hypothetical protein n=1 Tax=Bradyrhizobium TaxID=374 RepID=UPI001FEF65C9|nr:MULTISPECIES: hypothetical protein [Bradyrhizobium]